MGTTSANNSVYEFGPFRLETLSRRLLRDGEPVPLMPKAYETLVILIENHGNIVEKAELMNGLWPDSFVEEANLTVNISALRKALGEIPGQHLYIATVPGRGYKFVADVKSGTVDLDESISSEDPSIDVTESQAPRGRSQSRVFALVALALAIAVAAAGYFVWTSRKTNAGTVRSVAVLPFTSLDGGVDDDYLGLGITDDLITRLSNMKSIVVRPTTAIRGYTNREADPATAGRELAVDAVLIGNIQRSAERLRITVQLINVETGAPVWAGKFDEPQSEILSMQDRISEQVATAIMPTLTGEQSRLVAKRPTENVEAYNLYILARYLYINSTTDIVKKRKVVEYLTQAIELDPKFALAYAQLSDTYASLAPEAPPGETMRKAKDAANKALEIDPNLGQAHRALANVKAYYDWDWAGAENEFKRAVELDPNSGDTHIEYGRYLACVGRSRDSIAEIEQARRLGDAPGFAIMLALVAAREYERAIDEGNKLIEVEPNQPYTHMYLGMSFTEKSMHEAAIGELEKAATLSTDATIMKAQLGYAYAAAGRRGDAERILTELEALSRERYVSPYDLAVSQFALGDKDRTFEYLEKAYAERSRRLWGLKVNPIWDNLRPDPRFANLLQRIGLSL
jgi:DNA-binding winged helix-turn-helix (wHTH) protein/TolB-like protein/Flp pilus assembly protein TadD